MGILKSIVADARSRTTPVKASVSFSRPDVGVKMPSTPEKVLNKPPAPGNKTTTKPSRQPIGVNRVDRQAIANPKKIPAQQSVRPKIGPEPKPAKDVFIEKAAKPAPITRTPVEQPIRQKNKSIDIDLPQVVKAQTKQAPNSETTKTEASKPVIEQVINTTPAPKPFPVKKHNPEAPETKQKTSQPIHPTITKSIPQNRPNRPNQVEQKQQSSIPVEKPTNPLQAAVVVEKIVQSDNQPQPTPERQKQAPELTQAPIQISTVQQPRPIQTQTEPEPVAQAKQSRPEKSETPVQTNAVEYQKPILASKRVEAQTQQPPQTRSAITPTIIEAPRHAEVKIGQVDVFVEGPARPVTRNRAPARPSVGLASRHYLRRI